MTVKFYEALNLAEQARVKDQSGPMFREQNVIWASEGTVNLEGGYTAGECQRSLFYKYQGIEGSDMSIRLRNICDAGIMYEESIIKEFKTLGLFIDEQIRMESKLENTSNEIISSGKMDIIVKDGDKFSGIEVKTISNYKVTEIFGDDKTPPAPALKNLIQTMYYKYKTMNGPISTSTGEPIVLDKVYLLYIDRGTGTRMYFEIDMDDELKAVFTPISQTGYVYPTVHCAKLPTFKDLHEDAEAHTSKDARLSTLNFSLNDVMKKQDMLYTYIRGGILPPKDYSLVYTKEEADKALKCGLISKIKYNDMVKRNEPIGDKQCSWCDYKERCLSDDGIRLS